MARRSVRLTDAQWAKIERISHDRGARARVVDRGWPIETLSTAFSGSSKPARAGATCPRDTPAARPVGGDSGAGTKTGRGCSCGALPRPARRARSVVVGEHVHRRLIRVGEKRGSDVGKTKRGKGSKWMVVVDGQGVPVGIHVTSASPAEVTLVDATLKTIRVRRGRRLCQPTRLIADRAYDSDALRERLARRGITVIVPYRDNRVVRKVRGPTAPPPVSSPVGHRADLCVVRELPAFAVRHERLTSMYRSLLYFAAALIALRRF